MHEKLTIIDSKRVGKQSTLPTKNALNNLYDAHFVKSVYLDMWHVK